jgi:hypothetical protein
VVSKPGVPCGKRNFRFADWTPSVIFEKDARSAVDTCCVGRTRIDEIAPIQRHTEKLSKLEEEFVIQMVVQPAWGFLASIF